MTQHQIQSICESLNLGYPISPPTRVYGGLLHLMWRLDTETGSYAVKQISKDIHLSEATIQQYELTENIARQFAAHGIPAVSSLAKNGKSLIPTGENTFIIYPWKKAKTLDNDAIHILHAKKIASLLAKMHLLHLSVPGITKPTYDTYSSNELIVALIEKSVEAFLPFTDKLQHSKAMILAANEQYQHAIPILNQSLVVSHADLDPKNVLWDENNNPSLIDWESARALNSTSEILNAALDWSGVTACSIDKDLFVAMISAYKKVGGIIDAKDLGAFFDGVPGYCVHWMVYNIQRSLGMKGSTLEDKTMGIEQVNQVLQVIDYLNDKKDELMKLAY
ncbi:MAG TPA: phosphotransferase [Gammaproteobacteria bacterium]|nr:phosphotransferase [Gammaproteobacteria bacterium]